MSTLFLICVTFTVKGLSYLTSCFLRGRLGEQLPYGSGVSFPRPLARRGGCRPADGQAERRIFVEFGNDLRQSLGVPRILQNESVNDVSNEFGNTGGNGGDRRQARRNSLSADNQKRISRLG